MHVMYALNVAMPCPYKLLKIMFLCLTKCFWNFSFTAEYFFVFVRQFKVPSYISQCSPEPLPLLVKSGGTPEPFETGDPFGPFLRATKGEAFWWCYLICHSHVLVLRLLYLCHTFSFLTKKSLVCFSGIDTPALTPCSSHWPIERDTGH